MAAGVLALAVFASVRVNTKMKEQEEAIQACMAEMQKNCPGVFGYAMALEVENSRLNKIIYKLNESLNECESENIPAK